MVAGAVMPDVSRAIRRREFEEAWALLGEVIEDGDEVSRVLTVLIHTEPPPPAEGRGVGQMPFAIGQSLEIDLDRRYPRGQRYLEVLEYLAAGFRREEIARLMGIGVEGVKSHLKMARRELGTRNRDHSVAEALRRGLIA